MKQYSVLLHISSDATLTEGYQREQVTAGTGEAAAAIAAAWNDHLGRVEVVEVARILTPASV